MKSRNKVLGGCSRCKKKGKIYLPYSSETLCNECFCEFFEKRVRKTIRINNLLRGNDRTVVALSGGKDSAVVLYILKELTKRNPNAKLSAITIDHGFGKIEKDSLAVTKNLCKKLGVEQHIYSFKDEYGFTMEDVVKKTQKEEDTAPPCSYCGILRRKLINRKAKELGATKVATGHNMDDEVQAGMMNYIRGELARTARMGAFVGTISTPLFVPRIKPLRDSPENEVLAYAKIKKLPYKQTRCPYSREAFRQTIKKVINEIDKKHPSTKFQILKSNDELTKIMRERTYAHEITTCRICGEPAAGEVCKCCIITDLMKH